ncbi:tyrosine-type recombinase/integrase [Actinoplanes sp. NPDC049668]|uniref:tyrosine-type recombinase/integrase n=1 Tax=unclassified Actinoplanes TaxID=2626549 RepID=UPI0033A813CE
MPRPQLPIGTWGTLRREQLGPHSWRARARFRDYDGVTRDVEAHDTTGAKAENKLRVMLRDRSAPTNDEITAETRIEKLAPLWIDEITAEGRLSVQTLDRYQACLRQAILGALGRLRVRETTVGRLDKFFKALVKNHPAQARNAKVIIGQMLAMAVRHGAITTNPMRDIGRLPGQRRTVVALTVDDLERVRAAIRQWQQPVPHRSGPRRSSDLADIIDLLLGTGARIGEILAVRWQDLDLQGPRPTMIICGTIVYIKGRGFVRQEWTKSVAGFRTVILPQFAVHVLLRRFQDSSTNRLDGVFVTRNETWLSPNNVRRQWRQARADTGLEWVTPHIFRKTVATILNNEDQTEAATIQLGHGSEEVTKTYYIVKPAIAPDVTRILNTLGPMPDPQ